MKFCRRNQYRY